jgi:hypothetical protein
MTRGYRQLDGVIGVGRRHLGSGVHGCGATPPCLPSGPHRARSADRDEQTSAVAGVDYAEAVAFRVGEHDEVSVIRIAPRRHAPRAEPHETVDLGQLLGGVVDYEIEMDSWLERLQSRAVSRSGAARAPTTRRLQTLAVRSGVVIIPGRPGWAQRSLTTSQGAACSLVCQRRARRVGGFARPSGSAV